MKFISFNSLLIIVALTSASTFTKRPPREKPVKPPKQELSQEQKQIILANVAQVMNGVCTIAQDPRNPHTIGTSIATMIHALINIIIEKLAKRTITINNSDSLEDYINQIADEISKEITEIIIAKKPLQGDKINNY